MHTSLFYDPEFASVFTSKADCTQTVITATDHCEGQKRCSTTLKMPKQQSNMCIIIRSYLHVIHTSKLHNIGTSLWFFKGPVYMEVGDPR